MRASALPAKGTASAIVATPMESFEILMGFFPSFHPEGAWYWRARTGA
jgi:hypothetical protein